MDEYKISQTEIETNNVKSAADLLKGDPKENKNVFDRLPELIAERFNSFVEGVIAHFTGYYTKDEIDEKTAALEDSIDSKTDEDLFYGRVTALNNRIDETNEKFAGYYTKTEADADHTVLANQIYSKADSYDVYKKTQTYTKTETDAAIAKAVEELESEYEPAVVIVKGIFTSYDEESGLKGTAEMTKTEIKARLDSGKNVVLLVNDESGKLGYPFIAQYDAYMGKLFASLGNNNAVFFCIYEPVEGKMISLGIDDTGVLTGSISYWALVPKATKEDAGKVLTVNDSGSCEWQTVEV